MMAVYRGLIVAAAHTEGLDEWLVEAQVLQESGGNTWALNAEPSYRFLWDVANGKPFRPLTALEIASERPPKDFPCLAGDPDQEWTCQAISWGLMQIMGAVARERGFRGLYLTQLCDPAINLQIGCGLLAALLKWSDGDAFQALAAYNGGRGGWQNSGPQAYAAGILKRRAALMKMEGI